MAIVIDANQEYLGRTDFPTGDYTVLCLNRTDDRSTYQPIITLGPSTQETSIIVNNSTGWFSEIIGASATFGTFNLAANTWYGASITRDTSQSPDDVIVRGFNASFRQDASRTVGNDTANNGSIRFGDSIDYTATDGGRIGNAKAWDAVLTLAEIEQELRVYRPLRRANLWGWWPMLGTTASVAGRDWSGNGRNLSETGTLGFDAGPPIPFEINTRSGWWNSAAASSVFVDSWDPKQSVQPERIEVVSY